NIEDLSKTQLLLLTILVNFVTAIATCVMTVSLLDEAPLTVTQTVNRIVERTVETAAQTPLPVIPGLPVKEVPTPIVRDEDLLKSAIRESLERRVLIYKGATTTSVIAVGTYLPDKRSVVTATAGNLPKEATIMFSDGSIAEASLARPGATLTIYGFNDAAQLPSAPSPDLVPASTLSPGQTVVSLATDRAALPGIVSLVEAAGIRSTVAGVPPGAALVDTSGNIVGIATAVSGIFAPADRILTLLSDVP
ncbi:MAG: hypothetical protein Q8K68_04495, partial [Nitrospirota bacterium]|nr:hypothetical protein [Nitrospirota bacterium]